MNTPHNVKLGKHPIFRMNISPSLSHCIKFANYTPLLVELKGILDSSESM